MMEACDCEWRGLGIIPKSGMKLRKEWQDFDARIKYQMPKIEGKPNPACPVSYTHLNLLGVEPLRPVMNFMREEDEEPDELAQISKVGYGGILCIETGGPTPGLGCAGRGIIATFQLLKDMELFENYKPDVVLYDVLGLSLIHI